MTRLLAVLLTALAVVAGPSLARAQAEPSAASSSPAPSARQLELAREILDASGTTRNYDAMIKELFGRILSQTAATAPSANSKQMAEQVGDAMTTALLKIKPELVEMSATAYAQTFTEPELEQILAFYRSPAGQTMARKMPELTRHVTDATLKLMPQMIETMRAEVCARTTNCPSTAKAPVATPPKT